MGSCVGERMVYEGAWEKFKGNEKMKPPSPYYTPVRLPSVLHRIEVDRGCSGVVVGREGGAKIKTWKKMRGMEGVWWGL